MTNAQTRMITSAIALLAGAVATQTDNLNVNVGLVIILISGAVLVSEYFKSLLDKN